MREFDYLPYEKAIEAMAREYAKIKPINPLTDSEDKPESKPTFNSFMQLENTYCYNLEILMLLRQLKAKVVRQELSKSIDSLYREKTFITKNMEDLYYDLCGKHPPAPVLSRLNIPAILRRLLYLQTCIINDIKGLNSDYKELNDIEQDELKTSILLDNIILLITTL